MLVPLSWLREYVDIDVPVDEFAERMVMSGSNIETVKNYAEGVSGLVVGRVVSAERIDGSDHLNVCKVDVGAASEDGEPLQIVCGADNVRRPGILVVVALPGAVLPGDFKIKKTKLFGTKSCGMICSAQELGFEEKAVSVEMRDGIWILPSDFEVGSDAVKAIGLDETVIDFEITPNRPDCLSITGIAREAAAVFGKKLREHKGEHKEPSLLCSSGAASDYVDVVVEKADLCPRYVARVCTDIKIEASPFWMQTRLMFAGVRPISNIVDITNYVMLECGHPIHAFDIRQVEGGMIVVDTAKDGEVFTTLDGKERELSGDMLLINDKAKPVAIAGVMGGLNSGIVDDTETIIVEAANFNADSIRLTSKRLGLRSEASLRFEKGVSPELSESAADRVCALAAETGAGAVVSGSVDRYPGKRETAPIIVRVDRMNAVLGTAIAAKEMTDILRRLDMDAELSPDGKTISVVPPHVRVDLKDEIDFSEEIARIYGYDELGVTLHRDDAEATASSGWRLRSLVRTALTGVGYSEIQTYSFVSPKGVDKIMLPQGSSGRRFVRLINPLGEENSVMRTVLLPNLLDVLSGNFSRGAARARLFEIGNTFRDACGELPEERLSLSIGFYGGGDFYDLKGVVEILLAKLGIRGARYVLDADTGSWHPGRCARVDLPGAGAPGNSSHDTEGSSPGTLGVSGSDGESAQGNHIIGYMGEVHSDALQNYDIDVPVFAAELDFEMLAGKADMAREYVPLRRYPAATRDIALLADEDVTVYDIEVVARSNGGGLLEDITLFDVYRGEQIAAGKKSLAFNLVYRADDRTLTDGEVGKVHERILEEIAKKTGAVLREV
ncbi:MAG: phenylalanine--tRNA ligase subunit beta [Clostridiales Family XIII bacterium]|jgi:phenylalanyl-tRNA synthetase beta chain|nr:phenylalanine--tRNA ligase subunit beta [Clostridiales Family XIII bacterium]